MQILKKRTIITNLMLTFVVFIVLSICIVPENIVPIYGGDNNYAIYHGEKNSKKISIMINVYENSDIVNKMLAVLKDYNAKATFFVGGCWADDNSETVKNIIGLGHEVGNHGYFHLDHKNLNYESNKKEIENNHKIVKSLCDYEMNLFAPPSGSFSSLTLQSAFDLGYKVIMWSKDTIDWRDKDENLIYKRATNVSGGDFILMHPKEQTLKALPAILEYYKLHGFDMVTVSENLSV